VVQVTEVLLVPEDQAVPVVLVVPEAQLEMEAMRVIQETKVVLEIQEVLELMVLEDFLMVDQEGLAEILEEIPPLEIHQQTKLVLVPEEQEVRVAAAQFHHGLVEQAVLVVPVQEVLVVF
jgi:hypothetical protein